MNRSLIVISFLAACASATAPTTDELAGAETGDGGTFSYFSIRLDQRKCMWPICGGYFLSPVGCDGTRYTPALDWSEANLSDTSQGKLAEAAGDATAIVRGHFASDRFVVTEAWVAENDSPPEGVFVKVVPSGIVCITTPCPTLTERRLNSWRSANIAEIDWSAGGFTDREVTGFTDDIFAGTGAIIAGDRYYFKGGKGRTATAAYHRLHD